MDINQVSQALSNAFSMIIVASIILAVGLGFLGGLAWAYLWCGRKMLVLLHNAYNETVKPLGIPNGKKART